MKNSEKLSDSTDSEGVDRSVHGAWWMWLRSNTI